MGFVKAEIYVINQMIPPLVMVIGFTDAMHLTFAMQRARAAGTPAKLASIETVKAVGLACLLTSVTTAVGFGSLPLTSASVIRELTMFAAIGTLVTFVAVTLFVPLAGSFLHDEVIHKTYTLDRGLVQTRWYIRLIETILARPRLVVGLGALATAMAIYAALQLNDEGKIMLITYLDADARHDNYPSMTTKYGSTKTMGSDEFSLIVTEYWTSPDTQCPYPAAWILHTADLELTIDPYLADTELRPKQNLWLAPTYWEGPAEVSGSQRGRPYVELHGFCDI